MKRLLMCVALVGLTDMVYGQAKKAEPPHGHPKIKFDQMVYDFGTTSMVQSLTGTFTFQNKGDGVLEVRKPATSCGCTVAAVKPEKVEPVQKGELVFTLNLSGIVRGHIEKQITVPCNDLATPSVQLTVKADLFSIYEVVPPQVSFGDVRAGTSARQPITLKRTDGQNLAPRKATRPLPHRTLQANHRLRLELAQEDRTRRRRTRADPRLPRGRPELRPSRRQRPRQDHDRQEPRLPGRRRRILRCSS